MSSPITETVKEVNKRFEYVEKPIYENLVPIIGEERLKTLKKYLRSKRKAIIKGIPPRDAISRAIDSFFDQFTEDADIGTIQNFCEDTSNNYLSLQQELYDLINNFIDLAQDKTLVDLRDLDDVIIKVKDGKKVRFIEPLEDEKDYISTVKDKGSPDLISRAKAMAQVLNEELTQPFRSQANQVTLTEKLDTLCQYILVKNEADPKMEQVRDNLQKLEELLIDVMETKIVSDEKLGKIDKIIGFEGQVSIEAINQVEEGLGGFTIEGKPATLEELIPKDTTLSPVSKPKNINVEPSKMKFKPEQVEALENILFTLVGDTESIRNEQGYIDLVRRNKKLILNPKDLKKINKVIQDFREAFKVIGGQMLPETLSRKKTAQKIAIIDELIDIFTQKGIKGKTKSIGTAIDQLIKTDYNPFSSEFVQIFEKVKTLNDASKIPELYQKGELIPRKVIKSLDELKEAITSFNCDNSEHAKQTLLNIGEATETLEEKTIKDEKALQNLENAFKEFMKFDLDVQKLIKANKMTEGDFFKILDEISDICYNPALQIVKPEITTIPEDFDLESFIKDEFTKIKRKKERTKVQKENKRKALADLINNIWSEAKIKEELTPYERIKFQFGVTETDPKEMVEYINLLLNQQRPKLTPEKITEKGIAIPITQLEERPDPNKMKKLRGIKQSKEAIWIDTETGKEVRVKFKTQKALQNFLTKMVRGNKELVPIVSRTKEITKPTKITKAKTETKKSLKDLTPKRKRGRPPKKK